MISTPECPPLSPVTVIFMEAPSAGICIAIAYVLAILASDTIAHPRLEVIFTVSEEVGMEGASGVDVSMLKGRRLINLDSEEEGYLRLCFLAKSAQ